MNDPAKNIRKLKTEFYFEVGESQGRLHVHGVVDLQHVGNYQLCVDWVRAVLEKILGGKIHFNAQGSGNAEAAWQQYMTKKQGSNEVEL